LHGVSHVAGADADWCMCLVCGFLRACPGGGTGGVVGGMRRGLGWPGIFRAFSGCMGSRMRPVRKRLRSLVPVAGHWRGRGLVHGVCQWIFASLSEGPRPVTSLAVRAAALAGQATFARSHVAWGLTWNGTAAGEVGPLVASDWGGRFAHRGGAGQGNAEEFAEASGKVGEGKHGGAAQLDAQIAGRGS
jgi:hypothetical protein